VQLRVDLILLIGLMKTIIDADIRLTSIFQDTRTRVNRHQKDFVVDFIGAKDGGDGGDNYSCKTCNVPVKSSPPTNQRPAFYGPDALHVPQPTASEH